MRDYLGEYEKLKQLPQEQKLDVLNYLERNGKWYYPYRGFKQALEEIQFPTPPTPQLSLDWRDVALGVLVGGFPYAMLLIYVLEK